MGEEYNAYWVDDATLSILREAGVRVYEGTDSRGLYRTAFTPSEFKLAAALLAARGENETLRQALIAHRADLHNGSKRPCPTCRTSAKALGIDGKVPDSCAYAETDRAALAATPEEKCTK